MASPAVSTGLQNPQPDFKILRESPATAVIDGDAALGIHVGPFAMRLAVEKAKQCGVGTVTVFNHGHLGGAGYHAKLAADAGCIGCFGVAHLCPTQFDARL